MKRARAVPVFLAKFSCADNGAFRMMIIIIRPMCLLVYIALDLDLLIYDIYVIIFY